LRKAGFHPVRNAFIAACIRFGLDARGIWGANPTDLMHAFQSGLVMYDTKLAMDKLGPMLKGELDSLVDRILGGLRSTEKQRYPRLSFSKGFSRVSNITSDEWVGKLFVLLLVCSTHKGNRIFQGRFYGKKLDLTEHFRDLDALQQARKYFDKAEELDQKQRAAQATERRKKKNGGASRDADADGDAEDDLERENQDPHVNKSRDEMETPLRHCSLADFKELCEALLCFHSWYKNDMDEWFRQEQNKDPHVRYTIMSASIRRLLAMVKCYMPRASGNQWKIQKFHDMLHFAMDVFRFGNAKNFDAGSLESSLRYWAKYASRTAQTIGYNGFTTQVGARLYEFQCFAKARRELDIVGVSDTSIPTLSQQKKIRVDEGTTNTPKRIETTVGGSHFRVFTAPFDDKGIPIPGATCRPTEWIQAGGKKGKARKSQMQLAPMLEEYLRHQHPTWKRMTVGDKQYVDYWDVYTECCFSPPEKQHKYPEGMNIRAHPDYKARGPWYDWVMVEYDTGDHIFPYGGHPEDPLECTVTRFYPIRCHPCKVLGFYLSQPPPQTAVGSSDDGKNTPPPPAQIHAIVHECNYQSKEQVDRGSTLLEEWSLAFEPKTTRVFDHESRQMQVDVVPGVHVPRVSAVDINCIYDRCLVMEEEPGLKSELRLDGSDYATILGKEDLKVWKKSCMTVFLVRDKAEWGRQFIDGWDDDNPGYLQHNI